MKKGKFILFLVVVMLFNLLAFTGCDYSELMDYYIQYYDGTKGQVLLVHYDEDYYLKDIPHKDGYDFKGLFDANGVQFVDEQGKSFVRFTEKENMILYPKFVPQKVKVVFHGQDLQSIIATREINYGEVLADYPVLTDVSTGRQTYWLTIKNGQGQILSIGGNVAPIISTVNKDNFDIQNGTIHIYPLLDDEIVELTLYFDPNHDPIIIEVPVDTLLSDVVGGFVGDNDKAVVSWSTSPDDVLLKHVFDGAITQDTTLYAAEYGIRIRFMDEGVDVLQTMSAKTGNTVNLPYITDDGLAVKMWVDENGQEYYDTMTVPAEDVVLKPVYDDVIVLYDKAGKVLDKVAVTGSQVPELPYLYDETEMFYGWCYKDTNIIFNPNAMISGMVKLTPIFGEEQRIFESQVYDTTLDNGGRGFPDKERIYYDGENYRDDVLIYLELSFDLVSTKGSEIKIKIYDGSYDNNFIKSIEISAKKNEINGHYDEVFVLPHQNNTPRIVVEVQGRAELTNINVVMRISEDVTRGE